MCPHDELRMLCAGTDKPASFDAMLTVGKNELTYGSQFCTLYFVKIKIYFTYTIFVISRSWLRAAFWLGSLIIELVSDLVLASWTQKKFNYCNNDSL